MATTLTNTNGTFLDGLLDDQTGEKAQYAKVTNWADGYPMSDSHCDGFLYRKIGSDYYRRAGITRVNVLNLGLKADGIFSNELVLSNAMRQLPTYTEFYFPSGTYKFSALPSEYNNLSNIPVAIDWGTSGAYFTGAGESTVLSISAGCVGLQLNGGLVSGVPKLTNFTVQGSGQNSASDGKVTNNGPFLADGTTPNVDAGRTLGDWSLDPNFYQYSGINAWAQVIIDGVNVKACAGHGLWTQGYIGLKATTVPTQVSGTFINSTTFQLDDNGLSGKFSYGAKVSLGSALGFVGNNPTGNGRVTLDVSKDGNIAFPSSGHYTVTTYRKGGDLIADNGVIKGNCNFDFNGGCGIYIQGSDGNQWNVFGSSVRENGFWGIWDRSFLGNFFYGTHGSHNGNHFNKFAVNGIPHNDLLTIGSFKTSDTNAHSGWFGCYSEQGNQGPSYFEYNTVIIGGIHAAGITGSGFRQDGVSANVLKVGDVVLSSADNEIILNYGTTGARPLRLRRSGAGVGSWSFGFVTGTDYNNILGIPVQGTTITGRQGQTRISNIAGSSSYNRFFGICKEQTTVSLTQYLSSSDPKDDLVGDYLVVEKASGNNGIGPMRYRCLVGGSSPEYMPDDSGRGTDAQRPTSLLVMDAGWRYFSTTSKTSSMWNGTAWV